PADEPLKARRRAGSRQRAAWPTVHRRAGCSPLPLVLTHNPTDSDPQRLVELLVPALLCRTVLGMVVPGVERFLGLEGRHRERVTVVRRAAFERDEPRHLLHQLHHARGGLLILDDVDVDALLGFEHCDDHYPFLLERGHGGPVWIPRSAEGV